MWFENGNLKARWAKPLSVAIIQNSKENTGREVTKKQITAAFAFDVKQPSYCIHAASGSTWEEAAMYIHGVPEGASSQGFKLFTPKSLQVRETHKNLKNRKRGYNLSFLTTRWHCILQTTKKCLEWVISNHESFESFFLFASKVQFSYGTQESFLPVLQLYWV